MDNYQLEQQHLDEKYEHLQRAYDLTLKEIYQLKQKKYKKSRKVVVTTGYIKNVTDINIGRNKKVIEDLEFNLKQYLKGIDYVHEEMVDLKVRMQCDMSYGWSDNDECPLEWG